MDILSSQYEITQPTQWRRITLGLIRKKGGNVLLRRYNNSIPSILQTIYPSQNWNSLLKMNMTLQSSGPQHVLSKFSKLWFGDENVFQNYRHSGIHIFNSE